MNDAPVTQFTARKRWHMLNPTISRADHAAKATKPWSNLHQEAAAGSNTMGQPKFETDAELLMLT